MQSSAKQILPSNRSQRIEQKVNTTPVWTIVVAGLLGVFYLVTSIYIAAHRLFWFDELFTLHIARQPTWAMVWAALRHGSDALPPVYYFVVRTFDSLFGPGEIAARLPSALALVFGLLVIFDCARRLTDGLYGLIALSVATCSFLPYYGYEARSYAIYFLLAAIAFWLWTYPAGSKRWPAILFGATFLVGVCFHYYFVLCLAPYFLWELLHWKRGQRPSAKLIAGIVGAAIPVLLFSPLILSFSHKFGGGYWNRPSFMELRAIFSQVFPDGLFLLALMMVWIVLARSDEQRQTEFVPMQPSEAVGWLFLGVPLVAFAIAEWKTNAFFSRYCIGVLPGVAVAFAFCLWRRFRQTRLVSLGIFLLLATWGMGQQLKVVERPASIEATGIREFLQVESSLQIEGKRYFVFSGPLVFLEAQYYANHPDECVLLLPDDFNRPTAGRDPYLHQRLELNLSPYHPMQFWTVDDLRRHAGESALIDPTEETLSSLARAGITVRTRFSSPMQVLYPQ